MPQRCCTNINRILIERVDGLYDCKQEKKFIVLDLNFDMVIYNGTLCTEGIKTIVDMAKNTIHFVNQRQELNKSWKLSLKCFKKGLTLQRKDCRK